MKSKNRNNSQLVKLKPLDLSYTKIQKEVASATNQHPVTLYSGVVGVLGGLAIVLIEPSIVFIGTSIAGIVTCIGSFISNKFFRVKTLEEKTRSKLIREYEQKVYDLSISLQKELRSLDEEKASSQVASLIAAYQRFKEKIVMCIDSEQPEHEKYVKGANEIYLSAISNLQLIASNRKDMNVFEAGSIKTELMRLQKDQRNNGTDNQSRIDSLNRKLDLIKSTKTETQRLITEIEEALAGLFQVTESLDEIKKGMDNTSDLVKTVARFTERAKDNLELYQKIKKNKDAMGL